LRQAITLLQQNIPETLTVPEIARHLGISQRQLEQLFQRGVGCSLVQFGTLVRLRHARVLVIATRLSVREIAAATGFSTPSHCAIAFRKRLGRGAREYLQGWPPGDPNPTWPGTPTGSLDILQERTARILHQGRRAGA
jgi:AraC family carnitine catabolism transcriptional activator